MKKITIDYDEYLSMIETFEDQNKIIQKLDKNPNVVLIDETERYEVSWNYYNHGYYTFPLIKTGKEVESYLSDKIKDYSSALENFIEEREAVRKENNELKNKIEKLKDKKWYNIF